VTHRVFLLSPAWCGGRRAGILLRQDAAFDLAVRLRSPKGAPLGEVFAFMSGLYFRGKLTYGNAFGRAPAGVSSVLVITPCEGLRPPEQRVNVRRLERFGEVPVAAPEARYRRPLMRDAMALAQSLDPKSEVVLLGSIATGKYLDVLAEVLGDRLRFPAEFVGRGDMSRGGLLLRCVDEGRELSYVPFLGAERHGPRPPRLAPLARRQA
jgi:hypothetical protein